MRQLSFLSTWTFLPALLLCASNLLYANPVAPAPIISLSYQDTVHWVIEFDMKQLGFYDKMPQETDQITLGCAQNTSGDAKMQQCVLPVKINTDSGTGIATSMHFPGLKLKPRYTVYMGIVGDNYPNRGPELPENLQPNSTFTYTISRTTCTEYIPPDLVRSYECTKREYVLSKCPAYTRGTGRISGRLTDRRNKPLSSFTVACFNNLRNQPVATTQTDGSGTFQFGNLDPCPPHILQFLYNTYKIDYTLEPLTNATNAAALRLIQIEYPPVKIDQQPKAPFDKSSAVRILSTSGKSGNPIVVAVSESTLSGNGVCEIFTFDGERIRSLPFTSRGIGTYSIAWDGCNSKGTTTTSATYLCRISIGSELVCKSVIVR